MSKRTISVLCVDDHAVVREGIASIIDLQPDMRMVASAATGEQAVELFRHHLPDVTLMDLQLPGMSGLDAIYAIRSEFPDARIIVLTMYQGNEDIYRVLRAGAVTYLLKDTLSDDLARIVREVHAGERPISSEILARLAKREAKPALTRREIQVIELMSKGLRNKEIGAALAISEETVHEHLKNVFVKLEVHDRTAVMRIALHRGIIHLTEE